MAGNVRITYIGHSTLLIEIDGVRLLTDPLLRDWVPPLRRRGASVDPSLFQDIDAVLISHLHWDHMDIPSLKRIGQDTHLIVPYASAKLFHRRGFKNITLMSPGSITKVRGLVITATHAEHSGNILPNGGYGDCLGYLIEGTQVVYFPGDTNLFSGMADLAEHIDVALIPVWGWGPTLGRRHMSPEQAAEALELLRPRIAIPIHWGTFNPYGLGWIRPHLMITPPQTFRAEAQKRMPGVRIEILNPGSTLNLPGDSQA
jgi:L-ascorbate metabolism protein UlaG (beta-lactamase superfamily)